MKFLPALLLVAACASKPPSPAVSTEQACQRALAGLKADKAAGMSCATAKDRAARAEPLCPLSFTCLTLDGGAE